MPIARAASLCLCAAALALAACASTRDSFYTLSPATAPARDGRPPAYSVFIGPVRIPEIVDRPQFVVRRGANEVQIVEEHRWAQSLRTEIAQALFHDLDRRLPQAQIMVNGGAASGSGDYRVAVDVEQFDAIPGQGVIVQASWVVRDAAGKAAKSGQCAIREPAAGNGFDELAAAYGKAIDRMSVDIANAVSSLRRT